MTQDASQFVGNIPEHYDRALGPVIFEDYANDIARRAADLKPSRVLEIASGTGIVSRQLRNHLPESASLVVTDLNPPMLEVARSKFRPEEQVEFAPANAMGFDYPDGHFDLAVCQFGVMFFPDKQASFREALRVLSSSGTYLLSTWGAQADNPFAQITQDLVSETFPDDTPGFYRVPFSYPGPDQVISDLTAAGFVNVAHDTITIQKTVTDLHKFARGLVFGNPLNDEIKARGGIGVTSEEFAVRLEKRFREAWGEAPTNMPLQATVFTAQKPRHSS